jgi:hypothetical protein
MAVHPNARAVIPILPRRRLVSGLAALAVAAGLGLSAGCVTTSGSQMLPALLEKSAVPCQVVATWHNQVAFAPDPVNAGKPSPGLAGRIYLFGPQIDYPLLAEGSLIVDLYAAVPDKPEAGLVYLEQWRLSKEHLKLMERKDVIGWGYTVFLPWGTYRPDITQVQLKVRFEPANRTPLYGETTALTLNHGPEATPVVKRRQEVLGSGMATAGQDGVGAIRPAAATQKQP